MVERARPRRRAALAWAGYAALLALAPWVFTGGLARALLTQMTAAIILCLAFNVLLGQAGMLSFGQAIFSGAGSFLAVHALRGIGAGSLELPVSLVPLAGGLAGAAASAVLGLAATRRSGTAFAMITLGLGELVAALALMLPGVFGGEAGVTADRAAGPVVAGISFGPQIQVYYLSAAYCLACTALLFGFTRTPLGRVLNAVRDNADRVDFLGIDPRRVRWLAFIASGLFAGIAGGLVAIDLEIASAEMLATPRSATILLFTFLGGTATFAGPILGGVLMVLATGVLAGLTRAWPLYLGLAFLLMVMRSPGGLAGLLAGSPATLGGRSPRPWPARLATALAALPLLAGAGALIEMAYHWRFELAGGTIARFMGLSLDVARIGTWAGAGGAALAGWAALTIVRRRLRGAAAEPLPVDVA